MDASDSTDKCAAVDDDGEILALLNQPSIDYTSLANCNAERYWGKSCYTASLTTPYYSVATVYDHVEMSGCSSTDGNVTDVRALFLQEILVKTPYRVLKYLDYYSCWWLGQRKPKPSCRWH